MGVYIKGMEMPKNCMLCPFCVEEADPANGEMCMVTGKLMPPCNRERLDDCPLVPVPPHGRLIDADALIDYCKHFAEVFKSSSLPADKARRDELLGVIGEIINTPTIIPAEEGER